MEIEKIETLLENTKKDREWVKNNYLKYLGLYLPIQQRTFEDKTKVNNKIENPFRAEIVDQITGYLFGNPVSYTIEGNYSESEIKTYHEFFDRFKTRNTISDLDAETGTRMAATGKAFRLAYIGDDGYERLALLPANECVVMEDAEGDSLFGVWEKKQTNDVGEEEYFLEFYDDTDVYYYKKEHSKYELQDSEPHGFDYCPLIQFKNNDQMFPDFFKVETLIDSYDRLVSDAQNELEEFRLAYMYFKGFSVDPEEAEDAKKAGGFEIPSEGDIGFLTKQINDKFLENHKKTVAENIYKFSKSVDMSDEKFSGGTQTGESRKWKLLTLENRAIVKERKFTKALRYQWKVLTSSWARREMNVDYLDIKAQFTRNVPVELQHEAEIQEKIFGLVSDETRLSLFSPIEDVHGEIEKMKEQKERQQIEDYEEQEDVEDAEE